LGAAGLPEFTPQPIRHTRSARRTREYFMK
jgi:hypothetical protein